MPYGGLQVIHVEAIELMSALDASYALSVDGRDLVHSLQNWLSQMLVASPSQHRPLVLQTMYSLALATGSCIPALPSPFGLLMSNGRNNTCVPGVLHPCVYRPQAL